MNMRFIDYYYNHVAIFNIYYKLWENKFLFFLLFSYCRTEASVTLTDLGYTFLFIQWVILIGTCIIVLISIAIEYLQRVIN